VRIPVATAAAHSRSRSGYGEFCLKAEAGQAIPMHFFRMICIAQLRLAPRSSVMAHFFTPGSRNRPCRDGILRGARPWPAKSLSRANAVPRRLSRSWCLQVLVVPLFIEVKWFGWRTPRWPASPE
jgi:hypothetical protein